MGENSHPAPSFTRSRPRHAVSVAAVVVDGMLLLDAVDATVPARV
ncbi:hypothetical protein [Georgenia sp. H159]|nr:hypothetical protein [Georgenia sp. H159]